MNDFIIIFFILSIIYDSIMTLVYIYQRHKTADEALRHRYSNYVLFYGLINLIVFISFIHYINTI